jgi:dihydroneopterin aldolase
VRIGVPEKERAKRQKILIDLTLETDVSEAGKKDDFRLTVDYWAVEKAVRAAAEAREWQLVEALAESTASLILNRYERVLSIKVAVHKTPAVMPKTREVVVEILRTRH